MLCIGNLEQKINKFLKIINTKRLKWIRGQQYSVVKNKHPTKQIKKEKTCTNKERKRKGDVTGIQKRCLT